MSNKEGELRCVFIKFCYNNDVIDRDYNIAFIYKYFIVISYMVGPNLIVLLQNLKRCI